MTDWNPAHYLRFEADRNKPIYDLLCHIQLARPKRILDIGCGPGNSTAALVRMFPHAEVLGIDSSPNMISNARSAYPDMRWMVFDANKDVSGLGVFDVVFSNSVLHWLPDHEKLLPRLFGLLRPNGVFAAQIPYFFGTPLYEPLYDLIKTEKWSAHFPQKVPTTYHDVGFYYDILAQHFTEFDVWTTKHTHVLNTNEDIIDWYTPTGFKAFLDQLDSDEQKEKFLSDIRAIVNRLYHPQKNGRILLRFERLFISASAPDRH